MSVVSDSSQIPQVLHFCWFGDKPLTAKAEAALATWREHMPGWEIVRWDESNFPVAECDFSRAAHAAGKWAFVSDYARFKVLEEHGGIYMDVGSFLVRSLAPLAARGAFSAREWETGYVNPGLVLAAPAGHELISATVCLYERLRFVDDPVFLGEHTVNNMFASVLRPLGYTGVDELWQTAGFRVLPSEFFCPPLVRGGFALTENTFSYHEYSASWAPPHEQLRLRVLRRLAPLTGDFVARKTARIVSMLRYGKRR